MLLTGGEQSLTGEWDEEGRSGGNMIFGEFLNVFLKNCPSGPWYQKVSLIRLYSKYMMVLFHRG